MPGTTTEETIQIVNLILNAGGLATFLAALLTGFVYTRAAMQLIMSEKDTRVRDYQERNDFLNQKLTEITAALKDSVDSNKRLAEIWEDRQRRG